MKKDNKFSHYKQCQFDDHLKVFQCIQIQNKRNLMKYCLYFAKNILNNAETDYYLLKYSLKDIPGYFNNHILVCFSCKYMFFTNKHFVDYKIIDVNKFDKNQHISISIYLFIYSLFW